MMPILSDHGKWLLLFVSSLVLFFLLAIWVHEQSHVYVFSLVDCSSTVSYLPNPMTTVDYSCWKNLTPQQRLRATRLNSIVDVLSFQFLLIYLLISMLASAVYSYKAIFE